ncbi:B-cell receptor CD22-like [Phyllobates terribilis]|uniref:B-cell receptor CD22-like n=1 Tax=Phyllobates terribilis TaxID=111132 RepID=UPI003CCA7041
MADVKQMFLAIIFQGFYLGSVCQRWTFPSKITALIGSCVEIPCTYHPARSSGASSPVWYLSIIGFDPQILNTKKPSSAKKEYVDRTSLVSGDNSCTLRINQVTREDKNEYYPGIAEDKKTNAYDKQNSRTVKLDVRDSPEDIHLLYYSQPIIEGEATTIRCAAYHTCRSSPPYIQWNKMGQIKNQSKISDGSWREESELIYTPSYVDDGTPIQCTATYPNGQKTIKSSTIRINYSPQNVTLTIIGNDELIEGSNVTLQCNGSSKPDVREYEWYKGKNKTKLPYNGRKIGIINVTRDMEPYSCMAINTVGTGESALMEMPVLYPASGVHITLKNKTDFTKLICDFLSSRPDVTHYTWMKEGSILQSETEKTLTIDNKEENYGKYSCIAHNSAGNSSSDEIYMRCDTMNLPLILGTVFGVLFLLLFILVICFCIRKIYKSSFQASRKHTTSARMLHYNTSVKKENFYGNIHDDQSAQPDSMRSMSSVELNVNENYVIYSNSDVLHEVEYSDISHVQRDQIIPTSRVSHDDNVDYATLKH